MKIEKITWIDSCSNPGWQHWHEDDPRPIECESVGYPIGENEKAVTLAQSRSLEEGVLPYADLIHIPKTAIKKRVKVK